MRRARGEGSIHRRRDGRFEARLSLGRENGRRNRISLYGVSKSEVVAKLDAAKVRSGKNVTTAHLGDYLRQWIADGKSRWEPQTYHTYETIIRLHIDPFLGRRRISDIVPPDVRAWQRVLEDRNVGANTRKRALAVLRSGFKQLIDDWQLDRNPCDPVKGPKVTRTPFYVPSLSDLRRLLESAEAYWLFTLTLLAFSCTMREGELFALHWDQVRLDDESIRVDKSLAEDWDGKLIRKGPKNKYSVRTVYVPTITVKALRRLKLEQQLVGYDGPWVFVDGDGGPLRKSNFIRRHWRPLLEKAGLRYFKFYAGRHAGNSLLISQGEDPLAIAKRMGHADTRMTFDTYGHLFDGTGRRTAASMERGLDEAGIIAEAFGLSG